MRWVAGFVARLVGTILVTTLAVFAAIEMSLPGGYAAVIFPNGVPPEGRRSPRVQAIIDEFHFDDGMFVRWISWVGDAARGDFGFSNDRAGTSVIDLITPRVSISLQLMFVAITLAIVIGVPLGIFAAARSGRKSGTIITAVTGVFQSVPVFITPIFLVWIFALELRWLPAAGWVRISDSLSGNLKGLILPVTALALPENRLHRQGDSVLISARFCKPTTSQLPQARDSTRRMCCFAMRYDRHHSDYSM